jgi:hypothetical protein
MKTIYKVFIILFLTAAWITNSNAQNQTIRIQLTRPPPNMLGVGDMWNMELNNTTDKDMKIYLTGTATEEKDGLIIEGKSKVFTLKPGRSNFKYNDFSNAEVKYNNGKYKEIILRTGNAPEGSYTICVTAFDEQGAEVGRENCILQTVQQMGSISLLMPADGEEVDPEQPLLFTWTPLPKGGPYSIKIVELKGDQSPEASMKESRPILDKEGLKTSNYQYGITDPKLEDGKKYVWWVIGGSVTSEAWIFRPKPRYTSCNDFKVNFVKNEKGISGKEGECCYDVSINNNYSGLNVPNSFKISINNAAIVSAAGAPTNWNQTPPSIPPNTNNITWNKSTGPVPTGATNLGTICFGNVMTDPFYVKYEWLSKDGKVLCSDSIKTDVCGSSDSCNNNLIRNGGFIQSNVPGQMPLPGAVQFWTRGYGSPTVDNNPGEGFIQPGYIKLSGNNVNGHSVSQALDPNNKIVSGRKYRLSVAVRFISSQNTLDYVKIRGVAYNGNIFNAGGLHPQPSTDIAIIGRSGKIRDCGDWSVIEFQWTANRDFLNIAINAFTNDNSNATVFIDDVTLCETEGDDCFEVQLNNEGSPIIPTGYGNIPPEFTCQPEAEEDEYYNGSLIDLYPGYNGTSDLYSENTDPCFSIGGTLPPEVTNYNCDDSLRALGIDMTCDELQALLNQDYVPDEIRTPILPPLPPVGNTVCDSQNIRMFDNMAFHGRDIIFVHGLQLKHIFDRLKGEPGATGNWPNNQSEFYNHDPNPPGYYKGVAKENWQAHINYFLRGKGNRNRYLIVAYDCSESAEIAVHSILTQIREAMEHGTDVVAAPDDPRKKNCFGRDYVLVSHSTGALVGDVALSIANKTKLPGTLQNQYGDIGLISDRCKGRVSLRGAFSGSNLAKIVCMVQPSEVLFSTVWNSLSSTSSVGITPLIIGNSILVDLVPEISRARWGNYINDISVPVFTVASGHPSAVIGPLKPIILPGFDDGVETMDAANGNNNPLILGPSSFFSANPVKVFDMGIPIIRAIDYFLDQKRNLPGVFAAGSTAYLSPTGMVQPVSSVIVDPQNHFNNHFSFIQSSSEHLQPDITDLKNYFDCDYWRTSIEGSTNNEEQLVVSNASLFTQSLIDPSIISQMGETLRERHIWYPWIKIVFRRGLPRITIYWKKFYIWKRTYHKLNDNCMYDVDYCYKYLFKQ